MLKIENVEVVGWEAAIRGMRNPMNSWAKSDSGYCLKQMACHSCEEDRNKCKKHMDNGDFIIGPNDLNLMKRLSKGNGDDRKFMRMIVVYADITAPLYWWKEFDTYKVGTVANSCSTMHKIHAKEFELKDFSFEWLENDDYDGNNDRRFKDIANLIVEALNQARSSYNLANKRLKTMSDLTDAEKKHITNQKKRFWYTMIQFLPSSYNQKRTVMLNYEVLRNMYVGRENHKLDEWKKHDNVNPKVLGKYYHGEYDLVNKKALEGVGFCDWIRTLPYSELITGEE